MSAHRIAISVSFAVLMLGAGWGVSVAGAHAAATTEHAVESNTTTAVMDQSAATSAQPIAMASPYAAVPVLRCVQASSSGSTSCKDAGNFDSRCAVAKCGNGYTLTGGGGTCNAGNRRIKALNPNLSNNEFHIMCDDQGVAPQARAICCKL